MSPIEERNERVVEQPATRVVEEPSTTTYVKHSDPVGTSIAASRLIQTLVWSGVIIVVLVVGILLLVRYKIL